MPTVRGHIEAVTINGGALSPALYVQQCGRAKRPEPRHLVDGQKPDYICLEWVFRYSDGSVGAVTTRRAVT